MEEYGAYFQKKIEVTQDGKEYILKLYLRDQRLDPFFIGVQCNNDEEFLTKIRKELRDRELIRTHFIKINLKHGRDF